MLVQILSFTHHLTTMLFGIYISAFFLGVRQNRRNILTLFLLFSGVGILYLANIFLWGITVTDRFYALIVHLPLIIFLAAYYKYSVVSSCISVFSAYLCCQLSNWIGLVVLMVTGEQWCYYASRILITITTFFLLCKFVCRTTEIIFARGTRELYIIGLLPTVYYIYDYSFTKISSLLYSNNKIVVEFLGFVFCLTYFAFLLIYFREYEKKQEIKQYNELMKLQLLSIEKEVEQVKRSKEKLSILRHDMRHHLNIILTQLQNGNTKKAVDYIGEIGDSYDDTKMITYCKNEMINSVISIYHTRFMERNMAFHCDISVGERLPCPDTAICAVLSNALENAMHALEELDAEKRLVKLTISEKGNHLLIELENPAARIPKFADGIPVSGQKGHGIGIKSIVYYVEQLNGQYHFSFTGNAFLLRIII